MRIHLARQEDLAVFQGMSIKVWDLKTKRLHQLIKIHKHNVQKIALSSDGKTVVSAAWGYPETDWDKILTDQEDENTEEEFEFKFKFESPIIWELKTYMGFENG